MRPWLYSLLLLSTACSESPVAQSSDSDTAVLGGSYDQPRVLPLAGDLRTHDPSMLRDGYDWYVFSTGDPAVANGTIQIRHSRDLLNWEYAGNVFDQIPAWATAAVPGVTNLWAPEIHKHGNTFYLYYSVSTFGSNTSAIGLATNATLDPRRSDYKWVDRGLVTSSGPANDYNAIDPAVIDDETGTPYLAMGSFWSGIRMVKLQWPSGMLAPNQGEPLRLADRFVPPNAIEGASIIRKNGKYYMFVALDFCCRGTGSTYKIAVGRSDEVTGPYYDQLGTPLQHGGGTVILSENGTMFGPGGPSASADLLGYHWYDAEANGDFKLGLRTIVWKDGWPTVAASTDLRF
ncbi:MAG: arabinan endo-1,5-alpha-L-arabinosidase [Kofleriaceae bacterium]|nr:arabinan endo-1,5-alpha-L-arabinosidase [Kofleriaceae bacterium]